MWFTQLTGIPEHDPDQVRSHLRVEGNRLYSLANGRSFQHGHLEIPSLGDLRERSPSLPGKLKLREMVADVQDLHADPHNHGALFQVASQFNLLEMVDPERTPEAGIGIYSFDKTQGPACAIAAGAGTIYRNYLMPLNGQIGQSTDNQVDCIADMGSVLGNENGQLWKMKNGYLLPNQRGLKAISRRLHEMESQETDTLRAKLRIGLQWQTQVTLEGCTHTVSQAYCSALPVGYTSHLHPDLWAPFAQLVLEAAYEATFRSALINAQQTGNPRLFLTFLGGGAFGNREEWIFAAIRRALRLFLPSGLEVIVVSFREPNLAIQALISEFS